MNTQASFNSHEFDSLDIEIIKEYGRYAQLDGIINMSEYIHSKPKILWILKEPNWGEEFLNLEEDKLNLTYKEVKELYKKAKQRKDDYYPNIPERYNDWKKTFKNICYVTYGIHNKIFDWNNLPNIDSNAKIDGCYCINQTAIINVKKTPGSSKANHSQILKNYKSHKDLLIKQISIINPDIIINGSRVDELFIDISGNNFKNYDDYGFPFSKKGKQLIIHSYHPQQRQIYENDYVNNILRIVNDQYQ